MLDEKLLTELQEYLNSHLIFYHLLESPIIEEERYSIENIELQDFINNTRKPKFHQVLFSLIDKSGNTDPEVYKRAGLDRRLFSRIRSNPEYTPSKGTVIALALALALDKNETEDLLESAGYSLSNSDTFDLIIQFFLKKKIYDIQTVNEALDAYSLKLLGGV